MSINIENCRKLADYLKSLPDDYQDFGMRGFIYPRNVEDLQRYALQNGGVHICGTAACAIGHGPSAGILFSEPSENNPEWDRRPVLVYPNGPNGNADVLGSYDSHAELVPDWHEYSRKFIDSDDDYKDVLWWDWCFGGNWYCIDDTPKGAALRIEYLLAHYEDGLPVINGEEFYEGMLFDAWDYPPLAEALVATYNKENENV